MPRVLAATPHASGNTLAEAAITAVQGLFPGATTFPGVTTFPGHGSSLSASTTTPRTLTEASA